jgi:hypothetical protein
MRRILVLLAVVALMVVMLAMSVAPALAFAGKYHCVGATTLGGQTKQNAKQLEAEGYICTKEQKH